MVEWNTGMTLIRVSSRNFILGGGGGGGGSSWITATVKGG